MTHSIPTEKEEKKMKAKQKHKLYRLKDQLCKDMLDMAKIEEQMEHGESEMENHSKDKEDVRIIRKGMLNALEQTLRKQAIDIVKEEKEIEKLEAQLKENTTKKN
jgi:hypothetical protein